MDELVFPVAAMALVFFVMVPALTLISKAALSLRRSRTRSWVSFGADTTFAWLVAPVLLPVLWLVSATLHQLEPSRAVEPCFIDHVEATSCIDVALLMGLLLFGGLGVLVKHLREAATDLSFGVVEDNHPQMLRVAAMVASDVHLRRLRVAVAEHSPVPVCAVGFWRPRVILDVCFVRGADDALLRAALFHELVHVKSRDTLRGFVARLCLSINPLGSLLTADFARWKQAREALCDSEAVHLGGDPLALAEGIMRAARSRCAGQTLQNVSMLCGHNALALKLRVNLLLGNPPAPVRTWGHAALVIVLLVALLMPHYGPSGLLEHFHFEVERLFHTILQD